jgi:hypothetical protein
MPFPCFLKPNFGCRGSGVALRSLRFRTERRSQSRSGRRVAMPEAEQRRRHRVVVVTTFCKVNALTTSPDVPTTPPTSRDDLLELGPAPAAKRRTLAGRLCYAA